MRSLLAKTIIASGAALALAGCLVSEEPVLDARTGKATPFDAGAYVMCPLSDEADDSDCERFSVTVDDSGLYRFQNGDDVEDAAHMRFRRIARRGYAVQSEEDDGYMYYYGRDEKDRFTLAMMMCPSLSQRTRDRLMARGDLVAAEDDYQTCEVKTLAGLKGAARDYHHGRAPGDDEDIVLAFTPAPDP